MGERNPGARRVANKFGAVPFSVPVAAGFTYGDDGNLNSYALVRYNIDGTLDSGFGTGGRVRTGELKTRLGGVDRSTLFGRSVEESVPARGINASAGRG